MDRIIGAFTFRQGIYAEVEQDTGYTRTAWIIVAVSAILSQIGSNASAGFDNLVGWGGGVIAGTIFALIAFAIAAAIVNWVGRTIYKAEVTFDELVRTLGLAYVWQSVGVLGVLSAFSVGLSCVVAPAAIAAVVAGLVAWFVAAKEALDLETVQVLITVFVAFVVWFVISLAAGAVIALLGLGAGAIGGLLG